MLGPLTRSVPVLPFFLAAPLFLSSCLMSPSSENASITNEDELSMALATTATYEAESGTLSGAVVANSKAGYTGSGFVDFINPSGDYFDKSFSVGTSGTYTITFRYANGGTTDRPLKITDGSTVLKASQSFPPTGSWTTWKTVSMTVTFSAATHHVRAAAISASGANVDNFQVIGGGTTVPPTPTGKKMVGYLPDWDGDYSTWAGKLNWGSLTHLNLAFGNPNSSGVTTLGQSSGSINTLVSTAHGKGVKVLVSIGGAAGLGNASKWLGASRSTYVNNLVNFVNTYKLDGVDVDLEGDDVNSNYGAFVSDLVNKLRPNGKLVTAALAPWFSDGISSSTMQSFDFINVMAYDECGEWTSACEQSTYNAAQNMLNYYSGRGVAKSKEVLGVPFYAWCWGSGCGESEWSYAKVLAKYSTANTKDWYTASGVTLSYNGRPTIQKKANLARGYGGVMAWDLPSDATGSASLLSLAASTLWAP